MSTWLKIILAILNLGACWNGAQSTHTNRCNIF